MKATLKKSMIVMLLLAASMNGFSNSPKPSMLVRPLAGHSFALYLSNIGLKKTLLTIKDDKGHLLHSVYLNKKLSYASKFNLRNLPMGSYILAMENSRTVTSLPFIITESNLLTFEPITTTSYKPYIRHTGNELDVMALSPDQATHEIIIYNKANQVVFKELIDEQLRIERRYDVSALKPGSYMVTVNVQERRYNYTMFLQ
jgi:hypothetical protein